MWTGRDHGTNRHGGRHFNASPVGSGSKNMYGSFRWKIAVSGVTIGHFQELSGIVTETEVVPFQEGGMNTKTHQLMGQSKVSNLVLKNGFSESMGLWNWRQEVVQPGGRAKARKSITITLYTGKAAPEELAVWTATNAWPCKLDNPNLSSASSQLAVETCEIAYEELIRSK